MIIIREGDIVEEKVEAIVNAANTRLAGGGGVDGAIHRAAGPSLMDECRKIAGCKTGEAVITNGGNLKAKKIIHTVGPVWHGGGGKEKELLENAYRNSFLLAKENRLRSIAFPAISTGVYRYPIENAAKVALYAGLEFERDFDRIVYVCFTGSDLDIYNTIWSKIKE